MGAHFCCAPRGNWIGEAPYKTGRPCSECPPSYGGSCQNNLCYKGTWGHLWAGGKAGANLCKLLIRASHSLVPSLISYPQLLGKVGNCQALKVRIPELLEMWSWDPALCQRAWMGRSSSKGLAWELQGVLSAGAGVIPSWWDFWGREFSNFLPPVLSRGILGGHSLAACPAPSGARDGAFASLPKLHFRDAK